MLIERNDYPPGEPETHNPIGWINQFNEFDEQGIAFIPMIARPFCFNALRNSYLEVGKSNHRAMHFQIIGKLEEAYRVEGDTTIKFHLSFLDDNPRPDDAAIQALNVGAKLLLIGHGQPDERYVGGPTETARELGFRNDGLDLLEAVMATCQKI